MEGWVDVGDLLLISYSAHVPKIWRLAVDKVIAIIYTASLRFGPPCIFKILKGRTFWQSDTIKLLQRRRCKLCSAFLKSTIFCPMRTLSAKNPALCVTQARHSSVCKISPPCVRWFWRLSRTDAKATFAYLVHTVSSFVVTCRRDFKAWQKWPIIRLQQSWCALFIYRLRENDESVNYAADTHRKFPPVTGQSVKVPLWKQALIGLHSLWMTKRRPISV